MSAIETLAAALHAACLRDLPDIEYFDVDHADERRFLDTLAHDQRKVYYDERSKPMADDERIKFYEARQIGFSLKTKRPFPDGCDVVMFSQSWPNTACGYDSGGGLCGQAFTNAYTVIVQCHSTGCAAVYLAAAGWAIWCRPRNNLSYGVPRFQRIPYQGNAEQKIWAGIPLQATLLRGMPDGCYSEVTARKSRRHQGSGRQT